MKQLVCDKCRADLVAGINWYTSKGDHICCDCSGWPHYDAPTRTDELPSALFDANDYEGAILARQDSWYDD